MVGSGRWGGGAVGVYFCLFGLPGAMAVGFINAFPARHLIYLSAKNVLNHIRVHL